MSRHLLTCLIVIVPVTMAQFFYPCNYNGQLEVASLTEDQLTFSIQGNPAGYSPGQMYQMTVTSGTPFHYIVITGVVASTPASQSAVIGTGAAPSTGFQCVHMHTSVHPAPITSVQFYWIALQSGSGCISVVLRASTQTGILYNDVTVHQLCEVGAVVPLPDMVDVHSSGAIFRDDFDSGPLSENWNTASSSVTIGNDCGQIMFGKSAVFCGGQSQHGNLITKPLNLSSAASLQWSIGSGSCRPIDGHVKVLYRIPSVSSSWTIFKSVKTPGRDQPSVVHVTTVPSEAKRADVELMFSENSTTSSSGCWALDNVVIVSETDRPSHIYDNFDPTDANNWIFMPGGNIKDTECTSDGNAIVFRGSGGPTYVTSRDIDLSDGSPEGNDVTDMMRSGGVIERGACGHDPEEIVRLFNGAGARTYCTSPDLDLNNKIAAKFTLSIGSGNCSRSTSHSMDVQYYYVTNDVKHVIKNFYFDAYRTPTPVIVPIPHQAQSHGASICFAQRTHKGADRNVWGMGSFRLVDTPTTSHHFAQFRLNMNCGHGDVTTRIKLQYSTDLGRTWNLLQNECLPEVCGGKHWAQHTVYHAQSHTGWMRATVVLPPSALTSKTRFRWIEPPSNVTSHWSIDDVFIGSDVWCPDFCTGHGSCMAEQGCKCDVGYSGISCNVTDKHLLGFLSEDFNSGKIDPALFDQETGASVSFDCGIVGSGKSLVFSGSGSRELVTVPLNGTNMRFLQFTVLMGRYSDTGSCKPPSRPGGGVLVQYTVNSGTTWSLIHLVPFTFKRFPEVVTLLLPDRAKREGLQVRWAQQSRENPAGDAVWALDDVMVTSHLFKTAYSTSVNFHLGALQPYCNRSLVLAFTPGGPPHNNQVRFAETQSFHVTSGYVLQAEIVIGCGESPTPVDGDRSLAVNGGVALDTSLLLEYSVDLGRTWHLVHELSVPGDSSSSIYHSASTYHSSEYTTWMRATVVLPQTTWSESTRLRVAQPTFNDATDTWAVDNVYMGPACPLHCRNHGKCRNGGCICDPGYSGYTCTPDLPLPNGVEHPFDDVTQLRAAGWKVIGGHVVGDAKSAVGRGCDVMTSRNYLHFDKVGVRKLETPDIDTSGGGQIQFYVQIGGGKCEVPTQRSNGVLLQFSIDGGITWFLIQELYYRDFPSPTYVHMGIPQDAMTSHTRFRWWQPRNGGKNSDRWSIDDAIIGERMLSDDSTIDVTEPLPSDGILERLSEPATEQTPEQHFVLSNDGNWEDFCSPKQGSFVFNKNKGDRFVMTDDVFLTQDDVIQFQINIGCSHNFSYKHPVKLQYSADDGYTWDYVRHACYQHGRHLDPGDDVMHTSEDVSSRLCTGSGAELMEASKYHRGDFGEWKTVVIPVPEDVAQETVRFRWIQEVPQGVTTEQPSDWAITSLYIGPKCPDHCSGFGLCSRDPKLGRKCLCDDGMQENFGSCAPAWPGPSGFWEKFDGTMSFESWQPPLGGDVEMGCGVLHEGESLYFGRHGSRVVTTKPINTIDLRLIQFYLRIGSRNNDLQCLTPSGRNEGIILQYSTDAVTWYLIEEFSFDGYAGGESPLVTLNIPHHAKSEMTRFRWWQPLMEEGDARAQWAIDHVMIGRNNLLSNGFQDTFSSGGGEGGGELDFFGDEFGDAPSGPAISDEWWYRILGGQLGTFWGCGDGGGDFTETSLVFDSPASIRIAETWDFYLLSGSFLQFDLIIDCEGNDPNNEFVTLEFSSDLGRSWQPVLPQCLPGTSVGCKYGLGSTYFKKLNQKWTRHTVMIPESMRLPNVRFRWIQRLLPSSGIQWALDNVYLGSGCPWMCSGFGKCQRAVFGVGDECVCDPGFETSPHCQPSSNISRAFKDDFNHPWDPTGQYSLVVGRDPVLSDDLTSVGVMVSGENLQFSRAGVRMLQTNPINTTHARYLQFHILLQDDVEGPGYSVLVQSSINNGITWDTLERVDPVLSQAMKFVNVKLPKTARHPATVFRWWSSNFISAQDELRWALDNLVIGGRSSACDPHQILDDFEPMQDDNWLFIDGGKTGGGCQATEPDFFESEIVVRGAYPEPFGPELQDSSLVFDSLTGEHSLVTRDLCVINNDYVIQFKIKIGCDETTTPSSHNSVRLEFSADDGVTWHLVLPRCHGNDATPAGCTFERHQASIYYPGSFEGWRRVVIPLQGKDHICSANAVRFRWHQDKYPHHYGNSDVISWFIDDVYIGPACDQMCSGHGTCIGGGMSCVCDEGFMSQTCCDVIDGANPTFFKEIFDYGDFFPITSSSSWSDVAGGHVTTASSTCDESVIHLGQNYVMTKPGSRVLATRDIDTRQATFIQFHLKQEPLVLTDHDVGAQPTESEIEPILLQYSTDGGLSWTVVESFPFKLSESQTQYVAVGIPEGARANATRLRWWQPSKTAEFTLGWALDHVVVGRGLTEIEDDFSSAQDQVWIDLASSQIQTGSDSCCSDANCQYLNIGDPGLSLRDCSLQYAATNGIDVRAGSYIHFSLLSACGTTTSCSDLSLEFSTDFGHTWSLVINPCLPSDTSCLHAHPGSLYTSDAFASTNGALRRVVFPLPESTWSPETRFRWRVSDSSPSTSQWRIDDVYIGMTCPRACSGQGVCKGGTCHCDNGWGGVTCSTPTIDLQTDLKDVFSSNYDDVTTSPYVTIVGAVVDDVCGDMGYQTALHFNQACSRLLVTKLLDTSQSDYVQFMFRFGCDGTSPANRDQGVMVDYTRNGGITWQHLHEIYYKDHNYQAGFVNILLPDGARAIGVQFRWWQAMHDGLSQHDWAIDNLVISGRKKDKLLSDGFDIGEAPLVEPFGLYLDRGDKDMWQFYDNTQPSSFCGRNDVILAGVTEGLEASVGTKDFIAGPTYILQYTIVVLCKDIQISHQPVHVQYSVDFGDTWSYVTSQCLPSDPDCFVKEITQPSAHFVAPDWRRKTMWFSNKLIGKPVRFRFYQNSSDVVWALDRLYIGPACPDACSGHGDCVKEGVNERRCLCDDHHTGPNCYLDQQLQTYMKDTFNDGGLVPGKWRIVEAEKFEVWCGELIDGSTMLFEGVGPRQAQTVDLDLRDARFVQYHAVIGGSDSRCLAVRDRNDGVILQYSTDGGISWMMLFELDYLSYNKTESDSITLPLAARTNSTRLRWWQPFVIHKDTGLAEMGADRAGWALDDVYIGGHEVNTFHLDDDLETASLPLGNIGPLADEFFDFHPNAEIEFNQCGNDVGSRAIMWTNQKGGSVEQSLTTRQLIVSKDFLIQFRIKVGCGNVPNKCSRDYPVKLQYRESPSYPWQMVRVLCVPSTNPSSSCKPFMHHEPSVFTLDRSRKWSRVTIPLNHIESGATQFRWHQDGNASPEVSWALDDVYIGPACPKLCAGHGKCVAGPRCVCDMGYSGKDCGILRNSAHIRDFKDNFELPTPIEMNLAKAAMAKGAKVPRKWEVIDGGEVGYGGCGSMRPYGFGRSAYFNQCGRRSIQTVEMDLIMGGYVQYVLQIGTDPPRPSCHVNMTSPGDGGVLLQFSLDAGITWYLLQEHRAGHFNRARRVSVKLVSEMMSPHTSLRWWQPVHGGLGEDQWSIDNIEVIMTRENRFLHNLNAPPPLLPSRGRTELPANPPDGAAAILDVPALP